MFTTRQNKISKLLHKELADIFQKESRTLFHGKMITVTIVRISPDLSVAKVYLSVFPIQTDDIIFSEINDQTKKIRNILAQRVRHQLRKIPELVFYHDDSIEYAEKIDNLLKP
ncbi:MAG: 30S ribosome-binding factor RbfA [Bacteroidales bacterium]|nr:30S ribosome-binding factor RbfA [Bacteroidales bacterium]